MIIKDFNRIMKLQILLTLLLLVISFIGFSNESQKAANSKGLKWAAPIHKNFEAYIVSYPSEGAGTVCRPNLSLWKPEGKLKFGTKFGSKGSAQSYSLKVNYEGTQNNEDCYSITILFPNGNSRGAFIKRIFYNGKGIEIWKNSEYKVGFRPRTETVSGLDTSD